MIYNNGEVEKIRQTIDRDGTEAHPASDERLEDVRRQGANKAGLEDGQHLVSASDTVEALPDQPIPDGVEVVVAYDPSNNGVVYVGNGDPGFPLTDTGQALHFRVANLSAVSVKAPNAGDGVRYIMEVDA